MCVAAAMEPSAPITVETETSSNNGSPPSYATRAQRSGHSALPKAISNLVDKSFIFKVQFKNASSSKFEQYFGNFINKFNKKYMKSVDVNSENCFLGGGKQSMIEACDSELAQNLMPKFSNADVDTESQSGEWEGCDLSKDLDDLTPLKRVCATQQSQSDLELPPKVLKKTMKIEKK